MRGHPAGDARVRKHKKRLRITDSDYPQPFASSDRRDSNSWSPPWQGGALPTKLLSHRYEIILLKYGKIVKETSCILPSSDRRDSNSWSPPWQGGALPTKLLSHLRSRSNEQNLLSVTQELYYYKVLRLSNSIFKKIVPPAYVLPSKRAALSRAR